MRFSCRVRVLLLVYNLIRVISNFVNFANKIVCGDRSFTDERRALVIRNTSEKWPIEFVEVEYRPSGLSYDRAYLDPKTRAISARLRRRNYRVTDGYDDDVPL